MGYFSEINNVIYQFPDNIIRQYANLAFRPDIIQTVLQDTSNFELYTIQDGDTPETIAFDYYGDISYNWVVLLTNNITDYYTHWPKEPDAFQTYLLGKYRQVYDSDAQLVTLSDLQVLQYVEGLTGTITVLDSEMAKPKIVNLHPAYYIDPNTKEVYSWEFIENPNPAMNAYGQVIQKPINPNPVSIYDMEENMNDSLRNIILLKQQVISDILYQLRNLING